MDRRKTIIPVGSICHSDDNASDPQHRRIGLWLDADGRLWADAGNPHIALDGTFAGVEAARVAARRAWAGPQWAYRDED